MVFEINPDVLGSDDVQITTNDDGHLEIHHRPTGKSITLDETGTLSADAVSTENVVGNPDHYDYGGDDAPINIGVTNKSRAINIQAQTDETPSGSFGNIYWISDAGERLATIVANTTDDPVGDIAIYTKEDPLGSGDTGLSNRFQLKYGSDQTHADFYDLDILSLRGDQPDLEFKPTNSTSDTDTRLWWNDHTGSRRWVLRRRGSNAGQLAITNLDGEGDVLSFGTDGSINHNGQTTYGLRELGPTPSPSDLKLQEWAFTQDYNGQGTAAWVYRDSSGTAHVMQADDTLP